MAATQRRHKVCVLGSGNWGTTIAKVVAENTAEHGDVFEPEVRMWVFEEEYQLPPTSQHYDAGSALSARPQKLSYLVNALHENPKYLPNIALPRNLVAHPDIVEAVQGATVLIFNMPHQFIAHTCRQLQGKIVPYARGISCIKGVDVSDQGCELISDSIAYKLGIYCGALSGANIATEIAMGKYSETTVAYDPPHMDSRHPTPTGAGHSSDQSQLSLVHPHGHIKGPGGQAIKIPALPTDYPPFNHRNIKKLFHRPYLHVRVVSDVAGCSLGGALKNVVALAAGWVDGLGWGDNAKAAVMRVGLMEEVRFGRMFFGESVLPETFTVESCGVADLITSCMGGRNFRCARMSVQEGRPLKEIEVRELNGQKLQGNITAYEVNSFLKAEGKERDFPLFTAVYNILEGNKRPQDIPDLIEPRDDDEEKTPAGRPVAKL